MRDEVENHIWVDDEEKCWHCGEPTKWIELAFETYLHPGPCTEAKYDELEKADRLAAAQAARDVAQELFEKHIRPGDRKLENGTTYQWTGLAWRVVPRSELDAEQWRQR